MSYEIKKIEGGGAIAVWDDWRKTGFPFRLICYAGLPFDDFLNQITVLVPSAREKFQWYQGDRHDILRLFVDDAFVIWIRDANIEIKNICPLSEVALDASVCFSSISKKKNNAERPERSRKGPAVAPGESHGRQADRRVPHRILPLPAPNLGVDQRQVILIFVRPTKA
jgi:hypothetical protein